MENTTFGIINQDNFTTYITATTPVAAIVNYCDSVGLKTICLEAITLCGNKSEKLAVELANTLLDNYDKIEAIFTVSEYLYQNGGAC